MGISNKMLEVTSNVKKQAKQPHGLAETFLRSETKKTKCGTTKQTQK